MKPQNHLFHWLTNLFAAVLYTSFLMINTASAQSNPYAYSSVGPYFYRGTGIIYLSGSSAGYNLIYTNKSSLTLEGTLPGYFVNNGWFSPGLGLTPSLKARSLKILLDFTQHSTGVLSMELASNTVFDQLIVDGQAKLDGTLRIVSLNRYKVQPGNPLKILTAKDGVKGTFSSVDQKLSLGLFNVIYSSNAVELQIGGLQIGSVIKELQNLTEFQLTPNQIAVAKAVDVSSKAAPQAKAFSFLLSEGMSELPKDLDLIAPEEITALFQVTQANAEVHLQYITNQLAAARLGANGFISNLPVAPQDGKTTVNPKDVKDSKETKDILTPSDGNRWSVWMTGSGDFVNVGDDFNAKGFDFQSGGLGIGLDYRVSPSLILGAAGNFSRTNVDLSNDGNIDVESGRLAIYGTWYLGGAYINGVLGGAYNSYETHRSALAGYADGDTWGGEFDLLLGGGYDFRKDFLSFGPTFTIGYIYTDFNGFQENGSLLPLDFASRYEDSLRTRLGGHIQTDCKARNLKIHSELSLEWQHDYLDTNPSIEASYANLTESNFQTRGTDIGTDTAILGLGISVEWTASLVTYLQYEAELGEKNYDRQTISAGVQWNF